MAAFQPVQSVATVGLVVVAAILVAGFAFAAGPEKAQPLEAGIVERLKAAQIRPEHPRIWLDPARLSWLREKVKGKSVAEVVALTGDSVEGLSLAYAITGDKDAGRKAIEKVLKTDGGRYAGAICYDWCYPLLTDDEKKAIRDKVIPRCQKSIANGRTWRSFHNGMYSNGMLVGFAALAFYGDDPYGGQAMDFLAEEWGDALKTFENVFPDGAWGEGYDYDRLVSYAAMRWFLAVKSATGADFMADNRHLQANIRYMLYNIKPDGLVLPEDDIDYPYLGPLEHEAMLFYAAEYKNPYCQYFLNHCQFERFKHDDAQKWKDLLWYDAAVAERPLSELPLSHAFENEGLVVARSGWEWDSEGRRAPDTWVAFSSGPYYGDHAHYDNNTFQIYHKGELAIDSGRYDDDWGMEGDPKEVVKSEFFNYYQRTIAHNSMLVYDPGERMEVGVLNDGGQLELIRINGVRNVPEDYDQGTFPSEGAKKGTCDWATNPGRWDTGKLAAYRATDAFTYACGDATNSYSAKKLQSFVRQFVFVQPNIVIVFDRVVSTKPEFKKTWLLHTMEEPRIAADGASFEASYGEGRLVSVPLLPEKRVIAKIGGPEDECMVAGVRFHYGPNASSGRKARIHYGELPGAWRIEESPAASATEDYFLNVMLVTDKGSNEIPAARVLKNDASATAAEVATEDGTRAVVEFGKGAEGGASLKIEKGGRAVFDGALANEIVFDQGRR